MPGMHRLLRGGRQYLRYLGIFIHFLDLPADIGFYHFNGELQHVFKCPGIADAMTDDYRFGYAQHRFGVRAQQSILRFGVEMKACALARVAVGWSEPEERPLAPPSLGFFIWIGR